jgi:hypothetical protein
MLAKEGVETEAGKEGGDCQWQIAVKADTITANYKTIDVLRQGSNVLHLPVAVLKVRSYVTTLDHNFELHFFSPISVLDPRLHFTV